jgi:hypothetical protein
LWTIFSRARHVSDLADLPRTLAGMNEWVEITQTVGDDVDVAVFTTTQRRFGVCIS